jgi:DNA-binding phage protein
MFSLGLTPHDTSKTLGDPALVFRAFMACLQEGDHVAAQEILAGGLKHMNKSNLEKRYRIPRRTIYNLMDTKRSATLASVAKVCHALQQESLKT